LPGLLFESILFLLALYQFVQIKRHKDIVGNPPIHTVFIRDGAWAFVLMFGAHPIWPREFGGISDNAVPLHLHVQGYYYGVQYHSK
jgi:hypothetical protein